MITVNWQTTRLRQLPEGGDEEVVERGIIELDLLSDETYTISTEVTSHAVEEGVQISDHTNPQQDRVSAEVAVAKTPLDPRLVNGASFETFDLGDGVSATALKIPDGTTRQEDIFSTLRQLARDGTQVDVSGFTRDIEGWVIESVERARTVQEAGLLVLRMELVELRIAETQEVDAPSPRVERGRRRRNRGQQKPGALRGAELGATGAGTVATGPAQPRVTPATGNTGSDIRNAQTTAANPANNSTTTSNIRERATVGNTTPSN